jgi:hypothetical protein
MAHSFDRAIIYLARPLPFDRLDPVVRKVSSVSYDDDCEARETVSIEAKASKSKRSKPYGESAAISDAGLKGGLVVIA